MRRRRRGWMGRGRKSIRQQRKEQRRSHTNPMRKHREEERGMEGAAGLNQRSGGTGFANETIYMPNTLGCVSTLCRIPRPMLRPQSPPSIVCPREGGRIAGEGRGQSIQCPMPPPPHRRRSIHTHEISPDYVRSLLGRTHRREKRTKMRRWEKQSNLLLFPRRPPDATFSVSLSLSFYLQ